MTSPTITRIMREILDEHRISCQEMGIVPVLLAHRDRPGTQTPGPSGNGTAGQNTFYKPPGPEDTLDDEFTELHWIWWIHQPFIRGAERQENYEASIMSASWEQIQFPTLDIYGNWMTVEEEDFIIDAQQKRWRIMNPTISPDQGYWTALSQQMR